MKLFTPPTAPIHHTWRGVRYKISAWNIFRGIQSLTVSRIDSRLCRAFRRGHARVLPQRCTSVHSSRANFWHDERPPPVPSLQPAVQRLRQCQLLSQTPQTTVRMHAPHLSSAPSLVNVQGNVLIPRPELRVDVVAQVILEFFRLLFGQPFLALGVLEERAGLEHRPRTRSSDKRHMERSQKSISTPARQVQQKREKSANRWLILRITLDIPLQGTRRTERRKLSASSTCVHTSSCGNNVPQPKNTDGGLKGLEEAPVYVLRSRTPRNPIGRCFERDGCLRNSRLANVTPDRLAE